MKITRPPSWSRRAILRGLSATAGAGLVGVDAQPAAAEPPPETRSIRLMKDPDVPILCYAPQYLAEDFLRIEGFTDIRYNGFGDATSDAQVLTLNRADMSAGLGSEYIAAIDSNAALVVLAGLHVGCVQLFASERVRDLRDLPNKRIVVTGMGGPEHVFLSSVIAHIGGNPGRDVDWVIEPDYDKWPGLLATGEVDVVNAFPPQTYELREEGLGHVILDTTTDEPWRHFFCCMIGARRNFVERHPVATKRALRAFFKASQLCHQDKELSAKLLVERGATDRHDFARKMLDELPYGTWHDYDPRDTVRFFALRLREAGLVASTPREILERGTDFRHLDALRRELRV